MVKCKGVTLNAKNTAVVTHKSLVSLVQACVANQNTDAHVVTVSEIKRDKKRFNLKNDSYEEGSGCLQQAQGVDWLYHPALWLLDQIKGLMADYDIHLVWWWAGLQNVERHILSRMLLKKHRRLFHTILYTYTGVGSLYKISYCR